MSRAVWVRCVAHGENSEAESNRGEMEMVRAVRTAPLLRALADTGVWSLSSLELDALGLVGLAGFIADHAPCDAFEVVDEYGYRERVPLAGDATGA